MAKKLSVQHGTEASLRISRHDLKGLGICSALQFRLDLLQRALFREKKEDEDGDDGEDGGSDMN